MILLKGGGCGTVLYYYTLTIPRWLRNGFIEEVGGLIIKGYSLMERKEHGSHGFEVYLVFSSMKSFNSHPPNTLLRFCLCLLFA